MTPQTGTRSRTRKEGIVGELSTNSAHPVKVSGRASLFAGWAKNGTDLFREVWQAPAGILRPIPQHPLPTILESQVTSSTQDANSAKHVDTPPLPCHLVIEQEPSPLPKPSNTHPPPSTWLASAKRLIAKAKSTTHRVASIVTQAISQPLHDLYARRPNPSGGGVYSPLDPRKSRS